MTKLFFYGKNDPETGNIIIVAVNLDPYHTQGCWVRIPAWQLGIDPVHPYRVNDLLSGDKYMWQHEWNFVELDPHCMPAHIFKIEQEK